MVQDEQTEVFDRWAESYDDAPNPVLRLEERLLPGVLGDVAGIRILDAGCGSGRWMKRLGAAGARVVGFDLSLKMLHRGASGRLARARLERPPFRPGSADLVLTSFALSYAAAAAQAVAALVRPGGRLVVSDLHPDAREAGWSRGFRAGGRRAELKWERVEDDRPVGFELEARVEAALGEPERVCFEGTGRALEDVAGVRAVEIRVWRRGGARDRPYRRLR